VLFIVVVSVALVVVLKAFDIANQGSADPLAAPAGAGHCAIAAG
jgi:hypothetical protein